ncbi:type VI secretion protein VasK [Klebsiella pneumoniae]|uniref:Type VI secretion protein VasK n=1 Tax=Klebsiella pneumoniae TaxID=573 RepID=A0A378FZC4_KLEPN|nr:type VI secretion protein VasK [Klebsiella pneumoniae]
MDWVLSDTKQTAAVDVAGSSASQAGGALFADFSGSWLDFLNSLRWQRAATLSDAIDQLTLMADVRQSPLVALMNTLTCRGEPARPGKPSPIRWSIGQAAV